MRRGEESVSELCRREGITESMYYRWGTGFLEAGKALQIFQAVLSQGHPNIQQATDIYQSIAKQLEE